MPVPEHSVHYLEIVTHDADELRALYSTVHGMEFELKPELGNASVARLPDGSLCGIRPPMHEQENPVVRPYIRVADVAAAASRAVELGGTLALGPTELPGHGTIAIYFLGGTEQGLWQLP
jgi:predicted enzyme related to lactoylglutathione lyase